MRLSAIVPAVVLICGAAMAAACGRSDASPAASARLQGDTISLGKTQLGPGDVRIVTQDSSVVMVLAGESILAGLSDKVIAKVKTETDTSEVEGSGFGAGVEKFIKGTVQSALAQRMVVPLSAIDTVWYDGTAIRFKFTNDRRFAVGRAKTDKKPVLEAFSPEDAQRFVDAVQARKAGRSPVVASSDSAQPGWRTLFDGTSLAAWRGYHQQDVPDDWKIADGTLMRVKNGPDLITRDQFQNFELTLDWKISEGGNSGILYRVSEEGDETYFSGPEMQVLDDTRHPDGKSRLTSAGSDYALYPAAEGVVKPVGEWNSVRLLVNGNHVEHWLNGTKVVEYELGSPDWEKRVAESKFKQWPLYGRVTKGHIALQQHGGAVWYRNVRIKVLP